MLKMLRECGVFPTSRDVLCGRGVTVYQHSGNKKFRTVIALHLPKYTHSKTSRQEKTELIQQIVREQHQAGVRFLKEKMGYWTVLNKNEALTKVSQSLRDAAAKMNRCLDQGDEAYRRRRERSNSQQSIESESVEEAVSKENVSSSQIHRNEIEDFPPDTFTPNTISSSSSLKEVNSTADDDSMDETSFLQLQGGSL